MSSEWRKLRIGDVGRVVTGKTPSTANAENFGGQYPFITIPDLGQGREIKKVERSISETGALALRSCLLPAKAVLMSCIATIGKTGITIRPSFTNQQINSVICGPDILPAYLYYVFSQLGKELEAAGGGGSVYTNVSKSRFSDIEIPVPPIREQDAISQMLGALDDRITLLRETNATLEAIAQALFKSWFVDFDPVRAKMEGRSPEGMDEATAALFPDSFEETELGAVPMGWRVKALDEIANYLNGLALQKFPATGQNDLPVIKIAQLRKGDTVGADMASRNIKPEYIIQNGDVLFSWSGSLEVEIWCGGEGALNQHLFKVTSGQFPKWFYFLWTRHHLENFRQVAASKATTMGHIQRAHLTAAKVVVPSNEVLHTADTVMAPILQRAIDNALQAKTLSTLRDTLLPRLILGQLSLSEVEY